MQNKKLVNGRSEAVVDPDDRGLTYGDGLFETIPVRDGQLCLWNYHMDRLLDGSRRLGLPEPPLSLLREEARYLVRDIEKAVLKIIYTRGSGENRGYAPPSRPLPTRVLTLHEPPKQTVGNWFEGVEVNICKTRLSSQPALAGIKHLNRLEQVMARGEWRDQGVAEGLMLDENGLVVEGTATNVFVVQSSALVTPALDYCGVEGVMRRRIIDLAPELGLRVEHRGLYPEELGDVDELFLTNSVIGVWRVRSVAKSTIAQGHIANRFLERVAQDSLVPDQVMRTLDLPK
ncbi:aminodeoxychorismate lyase [Halorhodospira halochloris]|uniref:Aminodeoxychorismate lyase n=1 Tax=Halorhodospira halochloris TaxID=1052 RepID=A0A0X8X9L0_HALHR|nr:aminodeoxychorismate lyase [Halorhodospira halochloris]BAU58004.1 aminodeoxychorismate lyase [Halorhodospira halochloris]